MAYCKWRTVLTECADHTRSKLDLHQVSGMSVSEHPLNNIPSSSITLCHLKGHTVLLLIYDAQPVMSDTIGLEL